MSELKPCPFCGDEGVITDEAPQKYGVTYSIFCENCGAEITRLKKEEAAEAWNRRTE